MHPHAIVLLSVALASPSLAAAADLSIKGKVGYLQEWELSASLTPAGRESGQVRPGFEGSYRLVHTGACTTGDPETKSGKAVLDQTSAGVLRGTLQLDGATCSFSVARGRATRGFLECSNGTSVPMALESLR
jgi:hypothetical protein